ncbi:MAG TPA: hypothetical protein GXZ87_08535 [Bacteroidales bacterium]|nr:hypothetical protein [Bacteroidales bacterium]
MNLKSLKYIFTISLVLFSNLLKAQTDDVLLNAMKIEADRAKAELKRDSLARPFYISILATETDFYYDYKTSFGKESGETFSDKKSVTARATLLVGNYHRTQYVNNASTYFPMPIDRDEKAIRSFIWFSLDELYKSAARNYVDKMAWLKQENLKQEELDLDDFEKREPTVLIQDIATEKYDFKEAKKLSLEISKLLTDKAKKENLLVEDLSTNFSFSRTISRYYDTEGSMYRYPIQGGSFNIRLSGVTEKGEDIFAYRTFRLNKLSALPTDVQLTKALDDMVAEYKVKYQTENEDNPYMGPLLIIDDQVESVVNQIINDLYTEPKTRYFNGNRYQNLSGVRVISKQLSLKVNYGEEAQQMEGVKRDFAPIDIQAVIPPDSIILIENGLLKDMLTDRRPVKNHLTSNGNALTNAYSKSVEGVITFTGNERYSYDELKNMLMEEAKLQGLEYAYIINSWGKLNRKVNVETGEETEFTANYFNFDQIMKTMRRVMGVEDKMISSTDGTIRYPKSILLEDAELTVHKSNQRLKKDFVERPQIWK